MQEDDLEELDKSQNQINEVLVSNHCLKNPFNKPLSKYSIY